ncbi:S24 family peptidase [Massilia sp. YIM B02443]|uniref:S24 family peptidase n=1 Tax=Massilia sp. YIM B02443 TaxID=3050127 RepID=UPI0025B6802D|nr:S24 family peptidase [Massilia sp. YIM B02443]MDN4038673.1 S24 family peptidase [Massilia sp. YIM B02443]
MATRIEKLLSDKNGGNQSEMARYIGVSPQAVQKWVAGESEPRGKNLDLAAEFLGVTPAHLKFGIALDQPAGAAAQTFPGMIPVRGVEPDDPSLTQIMKVRIKVQAGITGFQVEPEHHDGETMGVPTSWVRGERLVMSDLYAIVVKGESMEPSLYDGDVIVVNTADKKLTDGSVYAVNYEGEVVVKRMVRDSGMWWLASDNADQRRFHRKLCKGAECIVIGKVVRKESTHI